MYSIINSEKTLVSNFYLCHLDCGSSIIALSIRIKNKEYSKLQVHWSRQFRAAQRTIYCILVSFIQSLQFCCFPSYPGSKSAQSWTVLGWSAVCCFCRLSATKCLWEWAHKPAYTAGCGLHKSQSWQNTGSNRRRILLGADLACWRFYWNTWWWTVGGRIPCSWHITRTESLSFDALCLESAESCVHLDTWNNKIDAHEEVEF